MREEYEKKESKSVVPSLQKCLGRFSYIEALAKFVNPKSQGLYYASVHLSYLSMAISN